MHSVQKCKVRLLLDRKDCGWSCKTRRRRRNWLHLCWIQAQSWSTVVHVSRVCARRPTCVCAATITSALLMTSWNRLKSRGHRDVWSFELTIRTVSNATVVSWLQLWVVFPYALYFKIAVGTYSWFSGCGHIMCFVILCSSVGFLLEFVIEQNFFSWLIIVFSGLFAD